MDTTRIESIKLKNYKVFKDTTFADIPRFGIIVGANGTGKSTLFDVFGFLRDCLTYNISQAVAVRGGFRELVSRGGESDEIEIVIQYRLLVNGVNRLVTYELRISNAGGLHVSFEGLRYKRGRYGQPSYVLRFKNGVGEVVSNEEHFNDEDKTLRRDPLTLDRKDLLAIKGVGQLQKFFAASALRQLIENWHVSDFHIDAARGEKDAVGFDQHLSIKGDNLQLVAQNLFLNHREIFDRTCRIMKDGVPGISSVEPKLSESGTVLLRFGDSAFKDPFIDRYVSDGTLRMFAYLMLLHDPSPHSLLCVEEPENQLYVSLLPELAEEFRSYAHRGGQVFVSTHSPDFLNAAELDEVFWLVKENGFTSVHSARDDGQLSAYMEAGDRLGNLWKQGFFMGVDP